MKRILAMLTVLSTLVLCFFTMTSCGSTGNSSASFKALIRAGYYVEIEQEYEHGIHYVEVSAELGTEDVELCFFDNEKDAKIYYDMEADSRLTLDGAMVYHGTKDAVDLALKGYGGVVNKNTPEGVANTLFNKDYISITVDNGIAYRHIEAEQKASAEEIDVYIFENAEDAGTFFEAHRAEWAAIAANPPAAHQSAFQYTISGKIIYVGTKNAIDLLK